MATGRKITEFTEVTSLADQDVLLVVDSSDTTSSTSGTTKKVSFSNVKTGVTSGLNTTNWDTAYGWGNHASANYIGDGDFTSSGLMKRGSSAGSYSIVADNSANWDTAYGWGDHSTEGYLTSLGDAAGVTSTKIAQWDAAYGWGNHGSVGYLTSVAMTNISDVDLSIAPSDGQVLKWEASSSSWKPANDLTGGSSASLSSFSVATATAGTASLSYSNTTGVFTYTPPTFASVASNGAGVTDGNLTTQRITVGGLDSTQNIKLNSGKYIYNGLDPAALGSTMGSIDISALGYATRGLFRGASSTSAIVFEGYYKPTGETVAKLDMKGDLYLYTTGGDLKFSATTADGVVVGAFRASGLTYPATDGTNGQVLSTDGAGNLGWTSAGGSTSPAGNNTQIQYNNNGSFGSSSSLTWDQANAELDVDGAIIATGSITGSYYYSNGGIIINGNPLFPNTPPTIRFNRESDSYYVDLKLSTTSGTSYDLALPINQGSAGTTLINDGSGNLSWGSTSSGLQSRTTANATTATLQDDAAGNIEITAAKTYSLLKVQTSAAAWVTIYNSSTSRTADASRVIGADPSPGSGVIAEVITTSATTQQITPGVVGWNDDGTPSSSVYLKVVNKSGSSAAITVTLTYVALEA